MYFVCFPCFCCLWLEREWKAINVLIDKFYPLLSDEQPFIYLVSVTISLSSFCFMTVYCACTQTIKKVCFSNSILLPIRLTSVSHGREIVLRF